MPEQATNDRPIRRPVPAGLSPSSRERSRGPGVAIPTSREARTYLLMTKEERQAVHDAAFAHRVSGPCPFEAAASVRFDTRGLHLAIVLDSIIIATGAAVFVLEPHATYYDAPFNQTYTLRTIAVFLTVLLVVGPALVTIPRIVRERSESRRIAASGPSVNPWASIDDDRRGRRSVYWRWVVHNVLWMIGIRRHPGL